MPLRMIWPVTAASTSLSRVARMSLRAIPAFWCKTAWREIRHLFDALILRLRQRGFEEHQFEQIRIVKVLGIAFEESHRCEFGRLDVQIPGLQKLEQRTQIAGAGGVNDDDALALFELGDDVVTVNRREQQHR